MRANIFFKIAVFDTESKYCPVKKLARSISLSFHSNKGINQSFCAERTSHHPLMTSPPLWPRLYRLYLVSVIITGAERGEKPKEVIELPESPDGSLPAAALISHLSLERFIYSVGVKAMSALSD